METAEPRARSRIAALILALVPGWGHVYWSREALGLVLFTLFAPCFFSLVYSCFLYVGPYRDAWIQTSLALLLLVCAGSWTELFLRTRPSRVRAEEETRADALSKGMLLYVRGDLKGAAQQFRRCLHADPFDVEAQFRLGTVLARAGEKREARRWLRRARKYDADEKWQWEIGRELGRLRSRPTPRESPRDAPAPAVVSEETQRS